MIPEKYLEICEYWKNNPCSGGNPDFPYFLWSGKRVLEIGCGAGNDMRRFKYAGALYTGIDIVPHAEGIIQMNAEEIDFPDNHFDLVYSWGVIHHTLNPFKVVKEIYRVLKPNGLFLVMLYNKPSIRYNLDIMFFRKILWFLHHPKYKPFRNKKIDWVSLNTDTLGCPKSYVYNKKKANMLFCRFRNIHSYTRNWGWFRIIQGRK